PAAALAAIVRRVRPGWVATAAAQLPPMAISPGEIRRRLATSRHLFDMVDLFVAPSAALRSEFIALGLRPDRIELSDYGFVATTPLRRPPCHGAALRIGFVGTLVWHKGAHVLIEAVRRLSGAFEVHLFGDVTVFPTYVERLRSLASNLPVVFE